MKVGHEFEDTEKLVDWILYLEKKYPVENWTINDVHIWPVIRNRLNISLFYHFNRSRTKTDKVRRRKYTESVLSIFLIGRSLLHFTYLLCRSLKKSKALFSGANSHRDFFEGKWVNKFIDPLIMDQSIFSNSYLVEYNEDSSNRHLVPYRETMIIRLNRYKPFLLVVKRLLMLKKVNINMDSYDEFLMEFHEKGVPDDQFRLKSLVATYFEIEKYAFFYSILMKKLRVSDVYGLCYYNSEMYGMNLAAYRMGIQSFEIQHGVQGKLHLAYAQFMKLPVAGFYELLPSVFWCWDTYSSYDIEQWVKNTNSSHKIFVGGHPWLNLWRNRAIQVRKEGLPLVLYTMQPYGELLPLLIIQAIVMLRGSVEWVLRLHPRQMERSGELKELIGVHSIQDCVVEDDVTLPEILARSSVHLTGSSATVIEAALMDVPSIVLHPSGAVFFSALVDSGKVKVFLNDDPKGLVGLIKSIVNNIPVTI